MLDRRPRMLRSWSRWAVALAAPLVATLLQALLWPHIPPSPHLLFYPCIYAVAALAGRGPAAVSLVLSAFAIAYRFLAPYQTLGVASSRDLLELAVFTAVSSAMIYAIDRTRTALEQTRAARLELEQADRAKDEILAIVSHDLRNPITAIGLSAETILRAPDLESTATNAERIRRLARTAAALVEDVMALARGHAGILDLEIGAHSASDLVRHARDAAGPEAEARRIALEIDVDTHENVLCDPARVRQVLANLIGNALRLTPAGGEVRISARTVGEWVRFAVSDTGPGIRPEDQARIFGRHFTTDRRSGSGLGLHIARTLVAAHGGEMGVDSVLGEGSTFWFTIPLSTGAADVSHRSADFRA